MATRISAVVSASPSRIGRSGLLTRGEGRLGTQHLRRLQGTEDAGPLRGTPPALGLVHCCWTAASRRWLWNRGAAYDGRKSGGPRTMPCPELRTCFQGGCLLIGDTLGMLDAGQHYEGAWTGTIRTRSPAQNVTARAVEQWRCGEHPTPADAGWRPASKVNISYDPEPP